MKLAPATARLTAPMMPLPPMPPPVLVAIWTASDIQLNSPASDTMDSPSPSESSSTGIVVPWIVSSMVGLLGLVGMGVVRTVGGYFGCKWLLRLHWLLRLVR